MTLPISIIIATWNRRDDLARCLASIENQRGERPEVWVVDDGGNDHLADWVPAHYPNAQVVKNHIQMGPSFRRNQGVLLSSGEYLLFLDSDSELPDPGFLENLLRLYESRPDIGELGGEMAAFAGEKDVAFGKGLTRSGYACRIPAPRERVELTPCVYLAGCNIFVRREIFSRVGGFDPWYSWGHEDTDLGLTITQRLGLRNYVHFSTGVWHHAQAGGRHADESRRYCRARVRLLLKHWGCARTLVQAAWDMNRLALQYAAGGAARARAREFAGVIWSAYREGWANRKEIRRARNRNFLSDEAMNEFRNERAG